MLKLKKQVMISARTARALTPLALALLLSLLLTVVPSPSFASAEVSYPLTYSGRLVNELGEPLAGPLALEFYFYDGAGVSAVPLRSTPIMPSAPVPLSDGVFSAQLSLTAADVQEIFGDPQREVWIEVRVGEQVFGRQRFSYVPFALRVPVDGETIYFDPADGKLKLKSAGGSGDMLQSIYDPGKNNKIDLAENAEKLGGQLPAYYSNASNITSGTLPVAQVPDLNAGKITSGTLAYARLPVGTAANSIAAGDDARFTNSRAPSGAAGGDLSGNYPNPMLKSSATVDAERPVTSDHIKDGAITAAKLADSAVTNAKLTGSIAPGKIATDASNRFVTDSEKTSWNTAASWGNHASAGYLTSIPWASPGAIGGTTPASATFTTLQANSSLKLEDADASPHYATLRAAPAMTADTSYTLPAAPDAGKYLSTDANGNLSWGTPSGSGDMNRSVYDTGNNNKVDLAEDAERLGGQLPAYYSNASNITTGTLPVAQIPDLNAAKITTGTLDYGRLPVGTVASTVAAGDDARFTNARTPSGAAGGDLAGSYPNPTLKSSTTVDADRAVSTDHIKDSAITTAKLAANAVTSGKIANDAVTSAAIANATIVDADIAGSAAIADSKLATISSAGKVSNSATTATSANTASAIVARDASGDFSAGTITASLSGNASSATTASQIQGRAVSSTAPSSGQVLTWDGSAWAPQTALIGGAAALVSKSADYTITSADAGKYFVVSGNATVITLPSLATVSSGFTVAVKSTGVGVLVLANGTDAIDGDASVKLRLGKLSAVYLQSDSSGWYVLDGTGSYFRYLPCGSNCYAATGALASGYAYTATGKYLTLFNGVWTQSDGLNVIRNDGSDNWQTFSLTYDANGGSGTAPTDSSAYLADALVSVAGSGGLSRTGYTLAGWNTQSNGVGTDYVVGTGSFTMGAANRTLYARWTINSYTVSYDANGATSGTVPSTSTHNYDTTVTVASNPGSLARTGGYSFAGWNTQANGQGVNYTAGTGTFTMGSANVTLYAKWNVIPSCGDSTANNCYSGTNAASLKTAGSVTTPLGKSLTWNTSKLVWEESGGTRVLEVNGTDAWQMQLAADGRSWTATELNKANVAGRACPTNVFVSNTEMVVTGRCLYYDGGNAAQNLNAAGTSQTNLATMGLPGHYVIGTGGASNGTGASWYEGNIKTCAVKGMRLPTLYETTVNDPGGSYKPTDASPTGWGSGVPGVGTSLTWTASAWIPGENEYWQWSGSSTSYYNYNNPYAVRCVVQ